MTILGELRKEIRVKAGATEAAALVLIFNVT